MNYKHHIFISYTHSDKSRMESVRKFLEAKNLEVWTDEKIRPGISDWEIALESAIKECGCLIVIATPSIESSEGVRLEIKYAGNHKIPVIPFVVFGEPEKIMTWRLALTQHIDAREDFESALQRLVDTIRDYLQLPRTIQYDSEYKIATLGTDIFPVDTLKNFDDLGETTKRVLLYINEHKAEQDRPPTVREIKNKLDLSSTSVVAYHLDRLENKGFLEQVEKSSRAAIVVKPIPKYHVFLSYSLADQEKAYQIEQGLISKQLRVCTIEPSGSTFTRLSRLQAEIRNSCCMISVLSPHAKHSTKVLSHLICAQENQTAIIPLLVSGTPIDSMPTTLPEKYYFDLSKSFDSGLETFIDAVLRYLGRLI